MTTNLGQIFSDELFRSGKDKRGGYQPPEIFNLAIRIVNQRKMNLLVDAFEKDGEVTSDLQPFIKTLGSPQYPSLLFTPVLSSDPGRGGYSSIPEDFWYQARANYIRTVNVGCSSTAEYRPVELVSQHVFDAIMQDSNASPVMNSENYPVMIIQNDKFYVYPYVQRLSFTYIREPLQPVFDYDIISGIWVYLPPGDVHVNSSVLPAGTPSESVEFEYPESCVDELTDMIKTYMAIGNEAKWNIETQLPQKNK